MPVLLSFSFPRLYNENINFHFIEFHLSKLMLVHVKLLTKCPVRADAQEVPTDLSQNNMHHEPSSLYKIYVFEVH